MTEPRKIGSFEIIERLGRGGMGTVFKARDPSGRIVALKQLNRSSTDVRHRFKREFRAAGKLQHPNIVAVHDLYEDPELFFTMEYVDGTDLLRFIHGPKRYGTATEPDQFKRVFFAIGQILKALDYIHAQGIVHRDLKPDNLLVNREGAVKITDFGLAKLRESDSFQTALGTVMGTVGYLAPEQITSQQVDGRTDLYGLGVVLYQVMTGQMPFQHKDPMAVLQMKVVGDEPVSPREFNPKLSDDWERLILRLLRSKPEQRYQSIPELFADLRTLWVGLTKGSAQAFDPRTLLTRARGTLNVARFCGRIDELRELTQHLASAVDRRPTVALIGGGAGVGKTRLLGESRVEARTRGIKVLMGRAPSNPSPYGHFASVFERIADWMAHWNQAELAAVMNPEWASLRLLNPRFNKVYALTTLPGCIPLPPRLGRDRDLRVITSLLRACFEHSPVLIVVEDLHLADRATIDLFAHLGDQLVRTNTTPTGFALFGTYRTPDVEQSEHGTWVLQHFDWVERMELTALNRESVGDMVSSMIGELSSDHLLEILTMRSAGNPLLVEQTLRNLIDRGVLTAESGTWTLAGTEPTEAITLPMSGDGPIAAALAKTVTDNLDRLTPHTREIIELGGIAADSFTPEIIARSLGCDEGPVLDAIEEAMRAGLVVEAERAHEPYTFAHQRIRDAVLEGISRGRVRDFHLAIARSLEEIAPDSAEELARHYDLGGNVEKALEYLPLAARRIARRFDNAGALNCYERALRSLDKIPQQVRSVALAIQLRREAAEIAELAGKIDDALVLIGEARELAEQHEDEIELARGLNAESHLYWLRTGYSRAYELAHRALTISRRLHDDPESARALDNLGRIARRSERFEEAEGYFNAAVTLHERHGDELRVAEALVNLSIVARKLDRHDRALELLERGQALFESGGDRRGQAFALSQLGALRLALCSFELAAATLERALEIDREIGNYRGVGLDLSALGSVALTLGDLEHARGRFEEALSIFGNMGDPQNQARALVNIGHTIFRSGDPAGASERYLKADGLLRRLGDKGGRSEAMSALAAAEMQLGKGDDARKHANEAVRLAREVGLREKEAWAQLTLARVTVGEAAAVRAVELAERSGDENITFQALHCLGVVLCEKGKREQGQAALRRAEDKIEEIAQHLGSGAQAFRNKQAVRDVHDSVERLDSM